MNRSDYVELHKLSGSNILRINYIQNKTKLLQKKNQFSRRLL